MLKTISSICFKPESIIFFQGNYSNSFLIPRVTLVSFYLSFSTEPSLSLFPSLFSQRSRLGSKSFGPCTYVTRHSAAKTVSRDVAPPRSTPPPSFPSQCLSSALLHHPSFPRAEALNLPFVRARSREVSAQAEERERRMKKEGGKW